MRGRIGTLHLRYHPGARGAFGPEQVPALDRAVRSGLSDALEARLSTLLGDDPSVLVIRELTASIAVGASDLALDSRVVDRLGRASADAVAAVLAAPPAPDVLVRFADQAEFIGSFVLDLLKGAAWDLWYYGAFHRYRREDSGRTIEAVLSDHRGDARRVFGWLADRGRLRDVLSILGPATARRLSTADLEAAGNAGDAPPLAAAAFDLLEELGWSVGNASSRQSMLAEYLATAPIPAAWRDRRSPSAWVLEFADHIVRSVSGRGGVRGRSNPDGARRLLTGRLDWLETAWLAPRLLAMVERPEVLAPSESSGSPILTDRHRHMLEDLAARVRRGRLELDRPGGPDAVLVQLLAASCETDSGGAASDRTFLVVLERIVAAMRTSAMPPESRIAAGAERDRRLEAVHEAGPAAIELLRVLERGEDDVADAGVASSGAGLFLLTRAILDVRLDVLARQAGVPFDSLLAELAMHWLEMRPPFDAPTALWVGGSHPQPAAIEAGSARLHELQQSLFERLVGQRVLDELPSDEVLDSSRGSQSSAPVDSEQSDACLSRIAWMMMRAWSRWLPGFAGSSTVFLVAKALRRIGHVRVTDRLIDVRLDPAPLDVVLELAGYFQPIEDVPWMDRRSIRFAARPDASA